MKTRTANWDYNRPERPAAYNGTCPICSSPCYSGTTPDGKIHTCPKCGHIPGDAAVLPWNVTIEAGYRNLRYGIITRRLFFRYKPCRIVESTIKRRVNPVTRQHIRLKASQVGVKFGTMTVVQRRTSLVKPPCQEWTVVLGKLIHLGFDVPEIPLKIRWLVWSQMIPCGIPRLLPGFVVGLSRVWVHLIGPIRMILTVVM